ncbi:unnamed protein product, partial [Symbiodinium sp. KB8]
MRERFQQVGGALRTLLANGEIYEEAVQLQRAEAKDFMTVQRAFEGDLSTFEEKKMPTRLFTYLSADGISKKAVQKGSLDGRVLHSPENYPGIDYLLDFNHGIQVTSSNTHSIAKAFREKLKKMFGNGAARLDMTEAWSEAQAQQGMVVSQGVQRSQFKDAHLSRLKLKWRVGVRAAHQMLMIRQRMRLYAFVPHEIVNEGKVTNSQTHTIAETFRQKLQEMFESADGHPSFTLT